MQKIYTELSLLQDEIKNSSTNIVLVGPVKLTKIFALECYAQNQELYERILYFMDDKYKGNKILEREVISLETKLEEEILYYIISSSDHGMFVMYKKLIHFGVHDKNIFIQENANFITKLFIENYNLNKFNIIECGAFGGTGQIFRLEKTLKDSMKIYAFEADNNELANLKSKNNQKYFFFNEIIDFLPKNSRKLYRISELGSWSFYKPNLQITHNYISSFSTEIDKVYEEVITTKTTTIDAILLEIDEKIDYLYINIDSAEYYAIQGALNSLKNKQINTLEIEVYFNDYFENQPLFSDIDKLMKENGYELLNFRYPNLLVPMNSPFEIEKEKLIHFNAIYTHNHMDISNLNNVLQHVAILELLGFPLKAFDMIKKILKVYPDETFNKTIVKIFEKYANVYNQTINIETFLEK